MNVNIIDEIENIMAANRAMHNPFGFSVSTGNTTINVHRTPHVFVQPAMQTVTMTPFGNFVTTTVATPPANVFNMNNNAVMIVNGQIVPVGFGFSNGCMNLPWC